MWAIVVFPQYSGRRTRSSALQTDRTTRCVSQKYCQLLHAGTTCTTSLEQIEVMELKGYSQPTYNKLVHLATTHSTVVGVIHKLTDDDYC